MPCPRLEASTWSAKEDLDTTGGRGSRVHNRLAACAGHRRKIARCGGRYTTLAGQVQQ